MLQKKELGLIGWKYVALGSSKKFKDKVPKKLLQSAWEGWKNSIKRGVKE